MREELCLIEHFDLSRLCIQDMEVRLFRTPLVTHTENKQAVILVLTAVVAHRDTGEPGPIEISEEFPIEWSSMTDDRLRARVFQLALKVLTHELAECFLVNGVRVHDPHAGVPVPVQALPPPNPQRADALAPFYHFETVPGFDPRTGPGLAEGLARLERLVKP